MQREKKCEKFMYSMKSHGTSNDNNRDLLKGIHFGLIREMLELHSQQNNSLDISTI